MEFFEIPEVQSWLYFLQWFAFGLFMMAACLILSLVFVRVCYAAVILWINFLWDITFGGETWKKLIPPSKEI